MPLPPSNRPLLRPRVATTWAGGFEALEPRRLLSSATISYPNFSSTAGLTANGFGNTAPSSGAELVITDSQQNEARSVFYNTPVPVDHFTTHFSYRAGANASADGFTFALQENGPTALGDVGGSLGYQGMGGNGVAVGYSIYGDVYEVYSGNSVVYSVPHPFNSSPFTNLDNGDTYDVTITYDGTTLTTSAVDETNSANTFTQSNAIDIHGALNAGTAYVGFTAGTGALVSTQRLLDWNYTGTGGPNITTPAAATPGVVTNTSTALSVAATDTNGGTLTYNWTLLHKPSGAANPTFTSNDSATANNTTAHFFKDGTYIFRATVTDTDGLFDVSDVPVIVHQTATALRVSPHAQTIASKTQKAYSASVTDQFGHPMRTQPAIVWKLLQGSASIDASTGLFTAGSDRGHAVIEASDLLDTLTGTVGATVV